MHVVVTDFVEPDMGFEEQAFRDAGMTFRHHRLRDAGIGELSAAVRDAEVIIVDQARISEGVLEAAAGCRLVIRHGDGYDNVDLDAATRLGIAVANKPGFWSTEVAEHALTLALSMCRSIPAQSASARARTQSADRKVDLGLLPAVRRIGDCTIGVIGFGKIGSRLVRMASSLLKSVLVYDPYVAAEKVEASGARTVGFDRLLEESDIITLHVPLNPETRGILGRNAFSRMRRQPIVVNAARGGVVDTEELLRALEKGIVSAAALDTTDPEPLPANHPLHSRDDVLITPHLGWYSLQAMDAMRRSIVSDVIAFADGRVPDSVVNSKVLSAPHCRIAR